MVYQIMVITRMMIIMGCSLVLFQAVNIAVKYSAVRRQFVIDKGSKKERKIIDFQTQLHILGPTQANALIIQISGKFVERMLSEAHTEMQQGKFELLDICHHFTAGMKAIATEM